MSLSILKYFKSGTSQNTMSPYICWYFQFFLHGNITQWDDFNHFKVHCYHIEKCDFCFYELLVNCTMVNDNATEVYFIHGMFHSIIPFHWTLHCPGKNHLFWASPLLSSSFRAINFWLRYQESISSWLSVDQCLELGKNSKAESHIFEYKSEAWNALKVLFDFLFFYIWSLFATHQ